jgi:cobalt-zinc-cadmium resistance protein CzcA
VLHAIIDASLRYRTLVIALAATLVIVGGLALAALDIDAFPDTTPVQVQINTTAPALGPEEVEQQITAPVEQAIGSLPGLEKLRSVSKFGLSQVVATFVDGTDIYFARQLVNERLSAVTLPGTIDRPRLGPIASGLGEVFHYLLTYRGYDFSTLDEMERVAKLTELRRIHDWVVKPKLRTVPGVAEVNSWGGYEKQYQVRLDPARLLQFSLTFDEVIDALERNNKNVGGGYVRRADEMVLVHGLGRAVDLEQIRAIPIATKDGVPIRVRHVADVEIGHELRRGAVTADGRGEAVLGLGFMLMGENSHRVTRALKQRLEEIKAVLPPGVAIETVYDRTELIDHVLETVRKNLFEGGLLVIAVLFAFLGRFRAALIVALAIPLSMLFAFAGMWRFGIAASLLSLGAIDFGMIIDSSVVMVENCTRHLAMPAAGGRTRLEVIRQAAVEVRKPTLFGELIIMIVYLPILTLEGIEGKLFRPMALTVVFALTGSLVLSMTLMPALASLVLPRKPEAREPALMRLAKAAYRPVLELTMRFRGVVIALAIGILIVVASLASNLGADFVPRLSEGALAINVIRLAGTDLEESIRLNTRMERTLLSSFPEIARVWSRIGTAEIATDPMGVELTDIFISLKPRSQWSAAKSERIAHLRTHDPPDENLIAELAERKADTQDELTVLIDRKLREFPGQKLVFSQPIELRVNEMISGVRSDVGVKLFGDDFAVLVEKAQAIEGMLRSLRGSADVGVEQITGQPVLQVRIKQDAIARYGVPGKTVLDLVEAIGGRPVGEIVVDQLRFPLVVRLAESVRRGPETIRAILVATPGGQRIPLAQLADVDIVEGPATITREGGQRRITITCNVRGRDMVGFVESAKQAVAENVTLPPGRYSVTFGGQFEHYVSSRRRLAVVLPLAVGLVVALLFVTYRNVVDSLRVLTGVPLGWVGGIVALWLRDMPFSISAAIGFIAMSGVAVLDDMILVSSIRQLRRAGLAVDDAVREAAMTRLRPVLMTTLVASLGFVPMAFSTGMGAEVQRPLATVVIGGVVSAMLMSLFVIRAVYLVFDGLARAVAWLLCQRLGLDPEQISWLVGELQPGAGSAVVTGSTNGVEVETTAHHSDPVTTGGMHASQV